MNAKHVPMIVAWAMLCVSGESRAQATYSEDFTGTSTNNSWYFFNGACLTAGTSTVTSGPGTVPGCTTVLSSYYANQSNADAAMVGGFLGYLGSATAPASRAQQVPDPAGNGALRFTNGKPYGHSENGAIISADTFATGQGIQVTFKTVTYLGNSGGAGHDGADGISFFLMDGSFAPNLGAWGGSLAYTCSNANNNYDGMSGGYVAVGIDEYGNFLNGVNLMPGYTGSNVATGDNTNLGYGYRPGRIGMRGAGNVSWNSLTGAYGTNPNNSALPYYPATLYGTCPTGTYYAANNKCGSCSAGGTFNAANGTCSSGNLSWSATQSEQAVQNTCKTGTLWNYSVFGAPTSAGPAVLASVNPANTANILDYTPIPNAYEELNGVQIAAEGATTRAQATPIFYNLKITQNGLLSLAYSIGGGAYTNVISGQSITASNGLLPASFRFGFAGSTGGSTNVHEIMCFKAAPAVQAGSSATVNEKQAAKVEAGTQAYFANYNPNDWTGTIDANYLIDTGGVVTVAPTANWDAQCLLTGPTAATCANITGGAPPVPGPLPLPRNRTMLTWDTDNNVGIPFRWADINADQQAALDFGDAIPTWTRLWYLRGDRSNEINSSGVGLYRARDGVLGDMVDSSPIWIGPPSSPWPTVWHDRINAGAPLPENAGQTYAQYITQEGTRLNVVYAGANDGFLHGFEAGSFDGNGNFVNVNNDGLEVLAYMPGGTLVSAPSPSGAGGCLDPTNTDTLVQNIHGWTPAIGANAACVDPLLDYANPQYGHNFFVDATPGTGDLFWGGNWHTWVVGGLGVGGAGIYALDVSDPTGSGPGTVAFAEGNAGNLVLGEWNPSTINCANVANCGQNLGNTFGTPQIRRLHNGNWAAIFGNGFGSQSGDAGIFIMLIDSTVGPSNITFYYLSTQTAGNGNGIAYTTPADLDGDHITDYVYAGDLLGNVWKFDLTSANPFQWGVVGPTGISVNNGGGSPAPLFTDQAGQPITSQLLAVQVFTGGASRLLIEFGTGQRTQITNAAPAQYASGMQSLYGVWDWNMSAWNSMSTATYASLAPGATGMGSPYTLGVSNLTAQTLSAPNANGVVEGTNVTVCWQGTSTCAGGPNNSFGWYANLPSSQEQIIYNPVFFQGAFIVNSVVPANNVPTSCTINLDTGYTYALSVANGGIFTNTFPTYTKNGTLVLDSLAAGVNTNATGSVYVVTTAEHTANIIFQTISGTPGGQKVNIPSNTKAKRLTWVERR